jgi:hypothetical protein
VVEVEHAADALAPDTRLVIVESSFDGSMSVFATPWWLRSP